MKIKLVRTGGIIPMRKEAETEVTWTKEDLSLLEETFAQEADSAAPIRDGQYYQLQYNGKSLPVEWEKIPAKFRKTFELLKDNLTFVKQ